MKGKRAITKKIYMSGSSALEVIDVNEIHDDIKAFAWVWDLYGGLLKKHRVVHSSVEKTSFFNSI